MDKRAASRDHGDAHACPRRPRRLPDARCLGRLPGPRPAARHDPAARHASETYFQAGSSLARAILDAEYVGPTNQVDNLIATVHAFAKEPWPTRTP